MCKPQPKTWATESASRSSVAAAPQNYVLPDVTVEKVNGEYQISLNDEQIPHLCISKPLQRYHCVRQHPERRSQRLYPTNPEWGNPYSFDHQRSKHFQHAQQIVGGSAIFSSTDHRI